MERLGAHGLDAARARVTTAGSWSSPRTCTWNARSWISTNYRSHASWQKSAGTEYLSIGGLLVAGLLGLWLPAPWTRTKGANFRRLLVRRRFPADFESLRSQCHRGRALALLCRASGCSSSLPVRRSIFRGRSRRALATGGCAAALALSLRSAARSSDWVTAEHFYQQTIASGGTSIRVSLNLGQIYASRGEYARAEDLFPQHSRRLSPIIRSRKPISQTSFSTGKKGGGRSHFRRRLEVCAGGAEGISPHLARRAQSRGHASRTSMTCRRRSRCWTVRAPIIPRIWEIVSYESELLRKTKGPAAAIPLVEKYRRENWWNYSAALALGQLRAQKGETAKAETALHDASWLDVHEVEALNLLAEMHVRQNRLAEACATQQRAVARQPNLPREYVYLSRHSRKKWVARPRPEEAIAKVTRLRAAAQAYGPVS